MLKYLIAFTFLSGCQAAPFVGVPSASKGLSYVTETTGTENLSVLSAVGGLCLIAGMVLLVVTRGARGWYPVIGGLVLVVLNYVVAQYSHWLFVPLVTFTALISGAWTFKTVRQILLEKKSK